MISSSSFGIVEVQVRLVRIEAVPVVGLGDRVPGPVRLLRIGEDDAGVLVFLVGVAPHIEVACRRARLGTTGALEPAMLVGGVVDHQLGDDADAAIVAGAHQAAEVAHGAVGRMDAAILGDVVAVVLQRRRIERQHPQGGDAEVLQIVELLPHAFEVADPVIVGIVEGLDVRLVDQRVLEPQRVAAGRDFQLAIELDAGLQGQVHDCASIGVSRQIAHGLAWGSRCMRWTLPCQRMRAPVSRSSASIDA